MPILSYRNLSVLLKQQARATLVAPQPQAHLIKKSGARAASNLGERSPFHSSEEMQADWNDWKMPAAPEDNPWPLTSDSHRPKSPSTAGAIGPPVRARSPVSSKPSLGTPTYPSPKTRFFVPTVSFLSPQNLRFQWK